MEVAGPGDALVFWSLQMEMIYMFVCMQSREVRYSLKCARETHVETHSNGRCKQTDIEQLSTCDPSAQDA